MAPLKGNGDALYPDLQAAYPWLGGHGSIEGPSAATTSASPSSIHGWEVMAPLKEEILDEDNEDNSEYPWLGGHGSIEGRQS